MTAASGSWRRIAGLVAGPACWGVSTQSVEIVAFAACDWQRVILIPLGVALIAVSAGCALVSLLAVRSIGEEWFDGAGGHAGRFVGVIGFVSGLLFALVIADQFAATLIIVRCAR